MFGRFGSFEICFPIYVLKISSQVEVGRDFAEGWVSFIFYNLAPELYAFSAIVVRRCNPCS